MPTPQTQLRVFLAKYDPAVGSETRRALRKLRALVPGATELVYDNYNALVVGFGPSERASEAVFSLAVFPKWVTLCFIQNGPEIPDPDRFDATRWIGSNKSAATTGPDYLAFGLGRWSCPGRFLAVLGKSCNLISFHTTRSLGFA